MTAFLVKDLVLDQNADFYDIERGLNGAAGAAVVPPTRSRGRKT